MRITFPPHIVAKMKVLNRAYGYKFPKNPHDEFNYSNDSSFNVEIPDMYIRNNCFLAQEQPSIKWKFHIKDGLVTDFTRE